MKDAINPHHYTHGKIECIEVIMEAIKDKPAQEAYMVGQIFKYLWRYEKKNGLEDIKKAEWYLNKLIEIKSK